MPAKRSSTLRARHTRILRRPGVRCWLCGREIDLSLRFPDPGSFSLDHVVAVANGGTDELGQKRPAHLSCNRSKSDREDGGPVIRRSGSLELPD